MNDDRCRRQADQWRIVRRKLNIITTAAAAAASVTIQSITRHSSLTHASSMFHPLYIRAERTDFYFRNNGPPLFGVQLE